MTHHTQYRRLPTRLPEVATLHDLVYLDSTRYVAEATARRMSQFARDVARAARIIVTPSVSVAGEVAERLSVPRERVVPAPLGVDHVLGWPRTSHESWTERGPYVVTVARIETRKNYLGVLRALESLGADAPRWLVAGPRGEGAEDFVRAVERSPLRDKIEFLGRVPGVELRSLVEGALAFLLVPFDEGFGLGPLEAMRLGTPAVTSDVPVVREVAGGGATLVEPLDHGGIGSALQGVLCERQNASTRGLAHAKTLTWAATASATVGAYRAALDGS